MFNIPIVDIVMGFSNAIELISPQLSNHQKRVAFIVYSIITEMGIEAEEKQQILIAGLLHDSGALHEHEMLKAFKFDFGESILERHVHGYRGWQLLRDAADLSTVADIVKFHHVYWDERFSKHLENYTIPFGSYIIHLADRIDCLINRNEEILKQRNFIETTISNNSGKMFMPAAVEAFMNISAKEYFWLNIMNPSIEEILRKFMEDNKTTISNEKLVSMVSVVHQVIDFRSNFTATHSIGVAECAKLLALKLNFSRSDSQLMYLAGLLHDIGKLAVPVEILEKNGPLNTKEYNIMKKHTFYSYQIIERIPQMEKINQWASFHHERIDGNGYPFNLKEKDLNLGSRIMAVSDVFTALTENRPYRIAMPVNEAISIMNKMVQEKHIDSDAFAVLEQNVNEINLLKVKVQNIALMKHDAFKKVF
jgi:putative nucleotidyltransferase with HDIG domain